MFNEVPKRLEWLYTPFSIPAKKYIESWKQIDQLKARVYDILNYQQQGVKELYVEEYGINFIYKLKMTSAWEVEDIVVLGMEHGEDNEFDVNTFSNNDIKSVQVLDSQSIDYYKEYLHALICEKECIRPVNTGMFFENQQWGYSRLRLSGNYQLIKSRSSIAENDDVSEGENDTIQIYNVDLSNPKCFIIWEGISVYEDSVCIRNFSKQNMEVCQYWNAQYVYALRETTLLFYWEIIAKADDTYSLHVLKNYEISDFWEEIARGILKLEWLERVNMEILFKRWASDEFLHLEAWRYEVKEWLDALSNFLSSDKAALN